MSQKEIYAECKVDMKNQAISVHNLYRGTVKPTVKIEWSRSMIRGNRLGCLLDAIRRTDET